MRSRPADGISLLVMAAIVGSAAATSLGLTALATAGRVGAEPDEASCTFTVSAPQLTTLSGGATAVTATAAASSCSGTVQPAMTTVCLSGGGSAGNCKTVYGWDTAQVFLTVTQMSGTFTAKANGCWRMTLNVTTVCSPPPPVSTTF